jgi:glycosyltransferase involved in cell wall biosynthesis
MIAGLVPVVTKTESGTELLENDRNALMCPVGDAAAIAACLAGLAQNRAKIPGLSREAFQTASAYLKKLNYAASLRDYVEELTVGRLVNAS